MEVAKAEFGIPGKKQTTSRIAILSGLTRKDVQRISAQPPNSKLISEEAYHRASRVITGWVRDPDFGDGKGHPHPLRMEGKRASFRALVKRYSGDIPVRALLDEVLRVGAVKQLKDGRICLLSRGYIPQKGSVEKLQVLGSDTADLIATIDHNVYQKPRKPRFQRKVMYDKVSTRHEAQHILSGYCGIDNGRHRDRDSLAQDHEARSIQGHRLDDSLDRIFVHEGIGRACRRIVGARGMSHCRIDEHNHSCLEVALATGFPVHRHHRRTGIIITA